MRFKKQSHYIILDTKTNLEWCTEVFGPMTWYKANNYSNLQAHLERLFSLEVARTFRLPMMEELITLIDFREANPASLFLDMPSEPFWSSSSYATLPSCAWYVDFVNGSVSYDVKNGGYHVRCVRRGRSVDSSEISNHQPFPPSVGRI